VTGARRGPRRHPQGSARGAARAWTPALHRSGSWWSQVWDVKIAKFVTECLQPLLPCLAGVHRRRQRAVVVPAGRRRIRRGDAGRSGTSKAWKPGNLLDPRAGLAEEDTGAPACARGAHPHRGLTGLRALGSCNPPRSPRSCRSSPGLISDGYSAYQRLLPQLAGAAVLPGVIRRCLRPRRCTARNGSAWP
jgi:hypothetical protein